MRGLALVSLRPGPRSLTTALVALLAAMLVAGCALNGGDPTPEPASSPQPLPPASPDGLIVSAPLRELALGARPTKVGEREEEREQIPVKGKPGKDTVVQRRTGSRIAAQEAPAPLPLTSWQGLGTGFSGPQGAFSVTALPPDPSLAVGPTQIVEIVNTSLAVFDKAGGVLLGPVATNALFAGFGGLCETTNDGDGVVAYDRAADRFVATWFAVAGADGTSVPFAECVAVSRTGDATGDWARYEFSYPVFPDYPKLAIWGDTYFVTFNTFNGLDFAGGLICGYDRERMITGSAARPQQCFSDGLATYGGLLVADTDSATPPPAGAPAPMMAIESFGALAAWRLDVDWTTPANSTLAGPDVIAVAPFGLPCSTGVDCVPQPGTTMLLDSLGDRLMQRLAYRNDGGVERLAVTHSVAGGTSAASVRWYELGIEVDRSISLRNQGTYAPTAASRWMGSAAHDRAGNLAIGYSLSSSTGYPSLAWAGRLATDPPDTLGQTEQIVVAGGSAQGNYGRWGDYSALMIDPVDECTFWYVGEYYGAASAAPAPWRTRIASFAYPACGSVPTGARISSPASPTNATTLTFGITFDLPVTGLDVVDLATGGTATGCAIGAPSGSGTVWAVDLTGCGEGTVTLTLAAGSVDDSNGLAGPPAAVVSASVLVDRTAPTVSAPAVTVRAGTTLSSTSRTAAVPVTVIWTRTGTGGAPVARYVLERSTNQGSSWSTVSSAITATSFATTVASSGTTRFRVRADDMAGNQGLPAQSRTLAPALVQQSSASVRYRGSWRGVTYPSYSAGTARYAKTAGASASYTFTGRSIAFVTTRSSTRGKVRIYVGSTLRATLDLYRSSSAFRSVVWQRTWSTSAPRTIKIVVSGTSGRPRVDLDAFFVIR